MKKSLLLAVALCCLPNLIFAQNKIDTSKEALNEDKGSRSGGGSSSSSSSSGSSCDDDDEGLFDSEGFMILLDYTLGVAWFMAVGDYQEELALSDNALTHYPFEHPGTGNYLKPDYASDSAATVKMPFGLM